MKKLSTLLLFTIFCIQSYTVIGQCEMYPFAQPSCDMIEGNIVCDITDLQGCYRMADTFSPGSQPVPLCIGQSNTAVENVIWIAFRAPAGSYSMTVSPSQCTTGTGPNNGMQIGIYTDCTFSEAVFCNANCNLNPVEIVGDVLTPGEVYYLFIDGCNMSVCDYSIDLDGLYSYDGVADCSNDNYFPFTSNTDWLHNVGSFGGSSNFWYQVEKDTIIAGQSYIKVVDPAFPLDAPLLFREDIEARQVFKYLPNENMEVLYYDFSLLLGDEFVVPIANSFNLFTVTDISYTSSNGNILRKWTLRNENGFTFTQTEGVGADHIDYARYLFISDPVFNIVCTFTGCKRNFGSNCSANARWDDLCTEAQELFANTVVDCGEEDYFQTVSGTIDSSCLQSNTGCDINGNTVWYKLIIDSYETAELVTKVVSEEDVVWAIYKGESCDKVQVEAIYTNSTDPIYCSLGDGNNDNIMVTPVEENPITNDLQTYWIAITDYSGVDTASYTLYYRTSVECAVCSGAESPADCEQGDFTALVDGEPSDGPFCPGQDVTVCFDYTYNSSQSGNVWLHGVIPVFGNGWDVDSSFDGGQIGANLEWFAVDGPCPPRTNGYDLPNLCTYMEDGVLKLCNKYCDPDCPCEGPLIDGSPLPSGWFVNTEGGSLTCNSDCSPAAFYGAASGVVVGIHFCLPLKVKEFVGSNCEEATDLSLKVHVTSDAITGCWEDSEPCLMEPSLNSPNWKVACDATVGVAVEADDATLCSGEQLDITVQTADGSSAQIEVTVEDNPNIEGAAEGPGWSNGVLLIQAGVGQIQDVLTNNSNEVQIVTYRAKSVVPDGAVCSGTSTEITVTVLPTPMIELASGYSSCEGEELTLAVGNAGDFVSFQWQDESGAVIGTDATLTFITNENSTVQLTATTAEGCSSMTSSDIVIGEAQQEDVHFVLCSGDTVLFNDVMYGEAGSYVDSLVTATGCVVTRYTITVELASTIEISLDTTICAGATFMDYTSSGTYTVEIGGVSGCDSLLTIDLTVADEPTNTMISEQYCQGDTLVVDGVVLTAGSGQYNDTTYTADGCIAELTTIAYGFIESQTTLYDTLVCEGDTVLGQFVSGEYVITLQSAVGCDSIVELDLTVLPPGDPNCVVGLADLLQSEVVVYPNPATDVLFIESTNLVDQYFITDITGKSIYAPSKVSSRGLAVDISQLRSGVYMLQVGIGHAVVSKKLVVQ